MPVVDLPPYEQPLFDPPPYGGPVVTGRAPRKPKAPGKGGCRALAILAGLIAMCGIATGGLVLVAEMDGGEAQITVPGIEQPSGAALDEGSRLAEWTAWAPALGSISATMPDARQSSIASRVVDSVFTDLTIEELLVEPGYYDDADDFHIADTYYFKGTIEDAPLAFYFWATPADWAEKDISWDESTVEDHRTLGELADGTQFEYDTDAFAPAIGAPTSTLYVDLLAQVAHDWPEGVCVWAGFDGQDVTAAWVYVTTWESYMDDQAYTGVECYYGRNDSGGWTLTTWDWYAD